MTVLGRAVLLCTSILALSLIMLADGQAHKENGDTTGTASAALPSTDVCGKRGGRFKRIVEGSDAEPGMFPWIAALGYRSSEASSTNWMCVGSLVTDRHLVTAAHCTAYANGRYILALSNRDKGVKIEGEVVSNIRFADDTAILAESIEEDLQEQECVVRLGVLDLNATEATRTEADYEVDTLTAHPGFSSPKIINNIAIIKLKMKVTFTRFVQPICLPTLSEFRTKNVTGSTGYITGWGTTDWAGPRATRLQQAQVRVWDQEKCKKVYEGQKRAVIDNKVVCAVGDDGSDTCQGDSGGPLMMPYGPDSNYYLYGVSSFGTTCGDAFHPSVYTRVAEYMDWILSNLK